MSTVDLPLPLFEYYLDESDPDIVMLCRQDSSFVAAFSARGATKECIDYRTPRTVGEVPMTDAAGTGF